MFELQQTAGLAVMDFKPANVGRRANGRCVLWDLGHSVVYPLQTDSERQTNELPVALTRNATLAINADGQTVKAKGRRLLGSRDASSGLCLVSNLHASEYCRALIAQGKGWGRVAGGTFGYSDQERKGQQLTSEEAYAYDMFAGGRSVLKLMTHKPKQERLQDWEHRARQAASAGPAGIRRMLENAVDPCARITQGINVERLANLIAGTLNPDPKARMGAQEAMPLNSPGALDRALGDKFAEWRWQTLGQVVCDLSRMETALRHAAAGVCATDLATRASVQAHNLL
jgi:hypothetical protein